MTNRSQGKDEKVRFTSAGILRGVALRVEDEVVDGDDDVLPVIKDSKAMEGFDKVHEGDMLSDE